MAELLPKGIRFLDNLLFSESRTSPAGNKYFREAELFIYYILGFTRKEIGSFQTVTSIGSNSRNSTLSSLFTDPGLSSSVQWHIIDVPSDPQTNMRVKRSIK